MSHQVPLIRLLVDRLKDKSPLVRKAAMKVMEIAMVQSPFGAKLDLQLLQNTRAEQRAQLQALEDANAPPDGSASPCKPGAEDGQGVRCLVTVLRIHCLACVLCAQVANLQSSEVGAGMQRKMHSYQCRG